MLTDFAIDMECGSELQFPSDFPNFYAQKFAQRVMETHLLSFRREYHMLTSDICLHTFSTRLLHSDNLPFLVLTPT